MSNAHDEIDLMYGDVTPLLSKAVRAHLVAPPGRRLIGGDFSSIEGRINAWFAGEQWKLDAFRSGADLYKVAFSRAFGVAVDEVTKPQRQIGKTMELAAGFQGAIGAWLRFDRNPTVVTRVITEQFHGTDAWKKAAEQYDRARHHMGLEANSWIAIKIVINSWREANARITQSWWDVQDAALEAVQAPGTVVSVLDGKIQYLVDDGFLWCRLPSGKLLAYARPSLVELKDQWLVDADGEAIPFDDIYTEEVLDKLAKGARIEAGGVKRTQVAFDGKNQKTGQWSRQYLYGGLQCNNYTQATARELLRFALHNLEEAGYPVVLHIHDEAVSEVDEGFGSVQEYEDLMSILPPWLEGLPLAAKAWSHLRYVK